MVQKLFIVLLSLFVLSKCQKCPETPGAAATVNCTLVNGCNFSNNGSLTAVATACDNELSDSACEALFPCPTSSSTGGAVCNRTGSGTDAASYPYVRAPACTDSDLEDVALQCKYSKITSVRVMIYKLINRCQDMCIVLSVLRLRLYR